MPARIFAVLFLACLLLGTALWADEIDAKYPLDPVLKVLSEDVKNPKYRQLVLEKMLSTDLASEWQRVETADNPESFLKKHGGKETVLADPDLKRAYDRRVQIRTDFLDLMREGYKNHKQAAPFDKGAKAEISGTTIRNTSGSTLALTTIFPATGAEANWPCFRGPSQQGHISQKELVTKWDKEGTNILWRTTVPGAGNSSPVVWRDRVFLTSASEMGKERFVHCFARKDGRLLWSVKAPERPPEPGVRDKNGFASATPVVDGERVISFLGSCGLVCHDFEGKLLWHYADMTFKTTHGTGSSPILYKDLVILVQDQNQTESVCLALNKKTGQKVWQNKRPRAMTWSTPVLVRVGDRDELIFAGAETVKGYEPATGKELWTFRGPTSEVVPMIVVGKHLIYSASGRNGPTIALRPGGEGDITEKALVWRSVRNGPHVPSPILVGGHLYTFNDLGVATCLDAETGDLVWQQRINDRFSASPIATDDLIYVPGESGITYVIRPGKKLDVISRNDLGVPILASLAVVDNQILLRTQTELVCIGKASR
jgi:outer membrane protein assembly factor BamB